MGLPSTAGEYSLGHPCILLRGFLAFVGVELGGESRKVWGLENQVGLEMLHSCIGSIWAMLRKYVFGVCVFCQTLGCTVHDQCIFIHQRTEIIKGQCSVRRFYHWSLSIARQEEIGDIRLFMPKL